MGENVKEIQDLEKTLSSIIKPEMTIDEKLGALENSFWRSHNAGYCDYIAGLQMGGIENGTTEQHDIDCKYKWEVNRLLELLKEIKAKTDGYFLTVAWQYEYDKESTWFDTDEGEETYSLTEGASYPLPHIKNKSLEIKRITCEGEIVRAEICVDYNTVVVCNDGEPVIAHASDSYSVCGDSVHQSLILTLSIKKQ